MMESAPLNQQNKSSSECRDWLPVLFVSSMIAALVVIYMQCHISPRLDAESMAFRATVEMVIFSTVTALVSACYVCCIYIHPGSIPDDDPAWDYVVSYDSSGSTGGSAHPRECKRSGDRRSCKWCGKYKPDRCHHCRVCRMCILKMDHHCPWIYNCVGFKNHKYFFLFILYAAIDCNIIVWTMHDSVMEALVPSTPFLRMFLLVFGETLAGFLGAISTLFCSFHIYLMLSALTTIEFCEKMNRPNYNSRGYSRGCKGNVEAVLGDKPLLWLLPVSPPQGSGLIFD